MKYRITLSRQGDNILISIESKNSLIFHNNTDQLISTQLLEDFMPQDYFFRQLIEFFPDMDHQVSATGLKLSTAYSDQKCDRLISELNRLASPEKYGRIGENYIQLIGKTPLLKLSSLNQGLEATVLVKLECMEPNSVKDRPVYGIVSEAVKRGEITADTEVVEASSGNVAFALSAILQAILKKKPKIFISKMHGKTKIKAVRASGCPVFLTNAEQGTRGAKAASVAFAKENKNTFQLNQHGNPDNPRIHQLTTGPELYHQTHLLTGQAPAEFVTGVGSGGTAVGIAHFREDIKANFKVIGVEPAEASLLTGGEFQAHHYSGIAPGFITGIVEKDRDEINDIEKISKEEGFKICQRMLVEEGFLVGATSGASIAAAIRRARLPENRGKVIVTIAHDRGDRYLDIPDLFVPPDEAFEKEI